MIDLIGLSLIVFSTISFIFFIISICMILLSKVKVQKIFSQVFSSNSKKIIRTQQKIIIDLFSNRYQDIKQTHLASKVASKIFLIFLFITLIIFFANHNITLILLIEILIFLTITIYFFLIRKLISASYYYTEEDISLKNDTFYKNLFLALFSEKIFFLRTFTYSTISSAMVTISIFLFFIFSIYIKK